MTKMTYVEALNTVLASATVDGEVAERLTALRDTLVKRASAPHKATVNKAKVANDGIRAEILSVFYPDVKMTIADICAKVPSCAEKTTHQMAGLLSALVKSGELVRTKHGKETFFSLADEDATNEEEAE